MRAYSSTLKGFYEDIDSDQIENKIKAQTNMNFGPSQLRAFHNSLPAIATALKFNQDIPLDAEVALEMRIPLTCKRIDFIIAGADDKNKDHAIIVELKQWEKVKHTDMPDIVTVDYYGRNTEEVHPSWQAYSYKSTISNFNEFVEQNDVEIHACAFLHNYRECYKEELDNPIYKEGIEKAYPYIMNDYFKLAEFVGKYIKKPSKNNILFEISDGKIKPSKNLSDSLAKILEGNKEFELIDDQRIVFSNLYKSIITNLSSPYKHVYIVKGGMGTGKTLISLQLLSAFVNKGMNTFYVAKSSYIKEAYEKKLTKDIPDYQKLRSLFLGSGQFYKDSNLNEFDCLIVDEAHRLTKQTKQSYMFYGNNQIQEIIHAAKNSVFFIDENQSIDIKDYGTIENIKAAAKAEHAIVDDDPKYTLRSQFRCNGSDEYIAWLESILYNKPFIKSGEKVDYDIKVFDDLCKMRDVIIEKNKTGNKHSRMLSGDVFPWKTMGMPKSKLSDLSDDEKDINIGDFHAIWNKDKKFAVDPTSIDEVGCIHTSQGMDFDYVGLIIGDDFIYRDGLIQTDYTKHPEKSGEFKRPHKQRVDPNDKIIIDRLIRNTYKVLMTRGQKGTYLYIMDEPLRFYIKEKIKELLN